MIKLSSLIRFVSDSHYPMHPLPYSSSYAAAVGGC